MLTAFQAVILGVVEGITEFLPVSSTGHMILTTYALGVDASSIVKSFEIFIQLGAILAVVVLFFRKMFFDLKTFLKLGVAFIPTAIIGFLLYDFVTKVLFNSPHTVIYALILGGIALILIEIYLKKKFKAEDAIVEKETTFLQAFLIGVFQSLALVPGVSRSAATIMGGLLIGVSRKAIVEFSFMLAVPVMASAVLLDFVKSEPGAFSGSFNIFAIGFITAFISAFFAVKFLLKYIQNHSFIPFGIYRILFAIACLFFLL